MNRPSITESPIPARALVTLVWAIGLLLLPSLACAGPATESTTTPQGDLVGRLPANAVTIAFIDFVALRSSPAYEFFRSESSEIRGSHEFQRFIDRVGMDPRKDLYRIALVAHRVALDAPRNGAVLAVAAFDRARLEDILAEHESVAYAGKTLWALDGPATRDEASESEEDDESAEEPEHEGGYVVILDDDTVAVGSRSMLEAILDVQGGAASARSNERLMALVEDVEPDSEIWMVSDQDQLLTGLTPRGDERPSPQIPVDKIRSLIFSMQLSDGVAIELRGRTAVREDAQLLGDSLNGMLAFGKMMLQKNSPEIFEILDSSVSAGSSGRDVTVRADLSMEDLQALRDFARTTFEREREKVGS